MALLVSQLVLAAFVGVILFSESNMPFAATPAKYFDGSGNLTAAASVLGMNTLLEHWAMAIHPPTLFVGYAGLTIPFAYAIAAIIVNDSSKEWVVRSQRYTLFSWFFLGVGIGLGAIWAYVVLGWGGYWGWDPVENASLLSWIVGVALIHSFTVYRQRGAFKRWSVMCACLTFAFVIVGTFISRSGLVQSVHAFEGGPVSLALFGALLGASILAGIVGLIVRWKSFGPAYSGADDVENMLSKDAAYYFNNVIMVVFAVLLTYMTVSSALPAHLFGIPVPFGGQTVSAGTYNAIARPLGVIYLAILAVCPLLSWGRTEGKQFWKRARIPGICAVVLFAVLMFYFVTYLLPSYDAILAAGGTEADVAKGFVDVAVITGEPTLPGLVYVSRGRNLYLPVASPDYISRNGLPVTPEQLRQHRGYIYAGPVRPETKVPCRGAVSAPVEYGTAVRSTDVLAIREAVLSGMGVAADMPLVQIYEDLAEGKLVPILPGWSRPPVECYIVTNRDAWHMKRVRVFFEWFAAAMRSTFAGYERAVSSFVGLPPDNPPAERTEIRFTESRKRRA